ncbi:MAG: dethiobiotin synthase [Oscillospiraceae bacterium]|nr:dethiobiotin synthase [Oscillospiraceae bacterium]
MSKGIFVTATGTDVGKTYVTALIVKKLRESGLNAGYYKAALSGADCIADSDAGYVNKTANINQEENTLISYLYKNAVSPHLAAKIEGEPVDLEKVKADYEKVCQTYDYVTAEGSGGIICPIRWDNKHILLEDIIKLLGVPAVVIAESGLGTINSTVLTTEYLKARGIPVKGIILNNYTGSKMQEDNLEMIEEISGFPVIACVKPDDKDIDIDSSFLAGLYE